MFLVFRIFLLQKLSLMSLGRLRKTTGRTFLNPPRLVLTLVRTSWSFSSKPPHQFGPQGHFEGLSFPDGGSLPPPPSKENSDAFFLPPQDTIFFFLNTASLFCSRSALRSISFSLYLSFKLPWSFRWILSLAFLPFSEALSPFWPYFTGPPPDPARISTSNSVFFPS